MEPVQLAAPLVLFVGGLVVRFSAPKTAAGPPPAIDVEVRSGGQVAVTVGATAPVPAAPAA